MIFSGRPGGRPLLLHIRYVCDANCRVRRSRRTVFLFFYSLFLLKICYTDKIEKKATNLTF